MPDTLKQRAESVFPRRGTESAHALEEEQLRQLLESAADEITSLRRQYAQEQKEIEDFTNALDALDKRIVSIDQASLQFSREQSSLAADERARRIHKIKEDFDSFVFLFSALSKKLEHLEEDVAVAKQELASANMLSFDAPDSTGRVPGFTREGVHYALRAEYKEQLIHSSDGSWSVEGINPSSGVSYTSPLDTWMALQQFIALQQQKLHKEGTAEAHAQVDPAFLSRERADVPDMPEGYSVRRGDIEHMFVVTDATGTDVMLRYLSATSDGRVVARVDASNEFIPPKGELAQALLASGFIEPTRTRPAPVSTPDALHAASSTNEHVDTSSSSTDKTDGDGDQPQEEKKKKEKKSTPEKVDPDLLSPAEQDEYLRTAPWKNIRVKPRSRYVLEMRDGAIQLHPVVAKALPDSSIVRYIYNDSDKDTIHTIEKSNLILPLDSADIPNAFRFIDTSGRDRGLKKYAWYVPEGASQPIKIYLDSLYQSVNKRRTYVRSADKGDGMPAEFANAYFDLRWFAPSESTAKKKIARSQTHVEQFTPAEPVDVAASSDSEVEQEQPMSWDVAGITLYTNRIYTHRTQKEADQSAPGVHVVLDEDPFRTERKVWLRPVDGGAKRFVNFSGTDGGPSFERFLQDNVGSIDLDISLDDEEEKSTSIVDVSGAEDSDRDPLFQDAKDAVVAAGKASPAVLQRKLRIGYARAVRILDELEAAGVIGPESDDTPREIFITREDAMGSRSTDDSIDEEDDSSVTAASVDTLEDAAQEAQETSAEDIAYDWITERLSPVATDESTGQAYIAYEGLGVLYLNHAFDARSMSLPDELQGKVSLDVFVQVFQDAYDAAIRDWIRTQREEIEASEQESLSLDDWVRTNVDTKFRGIRVSRGHEFRVHAPGYERLFLRDASGQLLTPPDVPHTITNTQFHDAIEQWKQQKIDTFFALVVSQKKLVGELAPGTAIDEATLAEQLGAVHDWMKDSVQAYIVCLLAEVPPLLVRGEDNTLYRTEAPFVEDVPETVAAALDGMGSSDSVSASASVSPADSSVEESIEATKEKKKKKKDVSRDIRPVTAKDVEKARKEYLDIKVRAESTARKAVSGWKRLFGRDNWAVASDALGAMEPSERTYHEARAAYIGTDVSRALEESLQLSKMTWEREKQARSGFRKALDSTQEFLSGGYKTLGEINLLNTFYLDRGKKAPESKVAQFLLRNASLRTGIALGLLGSGAAVGWAAGSVLPAALALGARRVFGGFGTSYGLYELQRRTILERIRSGVGGVAAQDLPVDMLRDELTAISSLAVFDGKDIKKTPYAKRYEELVKEIEHRVDAIESDPKLPEGAYTDASSPRRRKKKEKRRAFLAELLRDTEFASDDRIRELQDIDDWTKRVAIVGAGALVGSGAVGYALGAADHMVMGGEHHDVVTGGGTSSAPSPVTPERGIGGNNTASFGNTVPTSFDQQSHPFSSVRSLEGWPDARAHAESFVPGDLSELLGNIEKVKGYAGVNDASVRLIENFRDHAIEPLNNGGDVGYLTSEEMLLANGKLTDQVGDFAIGTNGSRAFTFLPAGESGTPYVFTSADSGSYIVHNGALIEHFSDGTAYKIELAMNGDIPAIQRVDVTGSLRGLPESFVPGDLSELLGNIEKVKGYAGVNDASVRLIENFRDHAIEPLNNDGDVGYLTSEEMLLANGKLTDQVGEFAIGTNGSRAFTFLPAGESGTPYVFTSADSGVYSVLNGKLIESFRGGVVNEISIHMQNGIPTLERIPVSTGPNS